VSLEAYARSNAREKLWYPVVDFSLKGGDERSYGSVNMLLPLAQDADSMFFADLRSVASDQKSWEGNAGLGMRQILHHKGLNDFIVGGYGFLDHRITEHGNRFHQVTLGVEGIGELWDGRVNVYHPVLEKRKLAYQRPATASLVGTQLFIQDGRVFEEAMRGFDAEIGHALPGLPNTRVYAGYYNFRGESVEDVSGFRARFSSDITDWVRVGAEYQFDNSMEDTIFGEIRLRMPFDGWLDGGERRKNLSPIQKRMTEPIMRDIDIITGSEPPPAPVPALKADGSAPARIYFVDNTAAADGDGSQQNPFNTLADASAAAGPYDTIYVMRGDGSTTNMDGGITLNGAGQRLIGNAEALTIDTSQLSIPDYPDIDLSAVSGKVIVDAGLPPVIANAAGDGITVAADDVEIAGLDVDGTGDDNIYMQNTSRTTIRNVRLRNATGDGIEADGASNLTLSDATIDNSGGDNIFLQNAGSAAFQNVTLTNATDAGIEANGWEELTASGLTIGASGGDNVFLQNGGRATFQNAALTNATDAGIEANGWQELTASGLTIGASGGDNVFLQNGGSATLQNVTLTGSTDAGIEANGWQELIASSLTIDTSGGDNIYLQNGSATFQGLALSNATDDALEGLYDGNGSYTLNITGMDADSPGDFGVFVDVQNNSVLNSAISSATLTNITNTNFDFNTSNNSSFTVALDNISTTGGGDGVRVDTSDFSFMDISMRNSDIQSPGAFGMRTTLHDSSMLDLVISDTTINSATSNAYAAFVRDTAELRDISLVNNTIVNAASTAVRLDLQAGASPSITNATISNNMVTNADGTGLLLRGTAGTGSITATISDNTSAGNTLFGVQIDARDNTTIDATITGNTIENNGNDGFNLRAVNDGTLDATVSNNISHNNVSNGFRVDAQNDGQISMIFSGNTVTGNDFRGMFINDDSNNAIDLDMGGGALGSTGYNRIFGNTNEELWLDMDVGGNLPAQFNWWGDPTGLPGPELDENSGTADTSNFLTSDPGL
jgi:hypothetical protein